MNREHQDRDTIDAIAAIPKCVDLDRMDGTWAHVVYRVEHPVEMHESGEDSYSRQDATKCRAWLRRYAPQSRYARPKR